MNKYPDQLNDHVSGYISNAPGEQRIIMEKVRQLVHQNVEGAKEEWKWSRPVFSKESDFLYLKLTRNYVTVGFFGFRKLDDPDNLLEGTGKDMRHIKIRKPDELNELLLRNWMHSLTK